MAFIWKEKTAVEKKKKKISLHTRRWDPQRLGRSPKPLTLLLAHCVSTEGLAGTQTDETDERKRNNNQPLYLSTGQGELQVQLPYSSPSQQ